MSSSSGSDYDGEYAEGIDTYTSASSSSISGVAFIEEEAEAAAAAASAEGTQEGAHEVNVMMTHLHRREALNPWDMEFYEALLSGPAALRVNNILLLVFTFVSADLSTLMSMSQVCSGWRERAGCLFQWQAVFVEQLPHKERMASRHVNSRQTFIEAKKLIQERKAIAAARREAAAWIPLRREAAEKLYLFTVFGAVCALMTFVAYLIGAKAPGLNNDVRVCATYFFTSLAVVLLASICILPGEDDDENSTVFGWWRTRHSAKTLLLVTYFIVLVMGPIVALVSIRVTRLGDWKGAHPSWSGEEVLYVSASAANSSSRSNVTTDPARWLPGAVVFNRPDFFFWASQDAIAVALLNNKTSSNSSSNSTTGNATNATEVPPPVVLFYVMILQLNTSLAPPPSPLALPQSYALLAAGPSTNATNTPWPPYPGPITFRTPFEADGYFHVDSSAAKHLLWYSPMAQNCSSSLSPRGRTLPLLVATGPTPEDLYRDYWTGLLALIYADVALFGTGIAMFFLCRRVTRCMWHTTIFIMILIFNPIQMAIWGGICYFSSSSTTDPPTYCLMSRASALALFIAGLLLTVVPQVMGRFFALCDD